MPEAASIAKAVAALFDRPVGVGVTDPRLSQPALLQGEAIEGRSTDARRREFAAGRAAARAAMRSMGIAPVAIAAAPSRAPIWPKGVQGSISHSKTLCVAVVGKGETLFGLDLEPAKPMNNSLVPEVLGSDTPQNIGDLNFLLEATLQFSAKEAVYKAVYPVCQRIFGFDTLRIQLDRRAGSFEAMFERAVPPFSIGDKVPGRYLHLADHFITAVTLAPPNGGN